ncbi:retrovirus-related pol polyprotein from transposon TNT 1-94 [Tanacetum coccineum]
MMMVVAAGGGGGEWRCEAFLQYENQRAANVARAKENVGTLVVQQTEIQCFNCKEFGHVARECQKPKRPRDSQYHKEKMLLCKQEEAGIHSSADKLIGEMTVTMNLRIRN